MRMRLIGTALVMLMLLSAVGSAAEDAPKYRIMPGDRVLINVLGQESLSGKFLVDTAGIIEVPVVGNLSVARLTLDELRQRLELELAKDVIRRPVVNVRIDEYRPIFVFGSVKTPGMYPFRPGMTVVGAMVVAGGEPKFETSSITATGDLIAAEERVSVLVSKRIKLFVRRAGLEVQRDERATLDLSLLPPDQRNLPETDDLADSERKRVQSEMTALRSEIELLQKQKPLMEAERDSFQAQIDAQKKILEVNTQRLADLDKLAVKGLARATSVVDMTVQQAIIEGAIGRLQAAKARNELDWTAIEFKIAEKLNTYRNKILLQIGEVKQELAESDVLLVSARNLRELRRHAAGVGRSADTLNNTYIVHRTIGDEQQRIAATPSMQVEPGDIVEVSTFNGDRYGQPSGVSFEGLRPSLLPTQPSDLPMLEKRANFNSTR